MAKKARGGQSYKTQYKTYKDTSRWRKNKIRKLEARVLKNPNDTGAEKALEDFTKGSKTYGRGKPGNKGWFHPQELALLKKIKHDGTPEDKVLINKLHKLRAVYADTRPSPLRKTSSIELGDTIADQLFNAGLINEKRRETANSRMERIRKR